MKRIVVGTLLVLLPLFWVFVTPSGRRWQLERKSITDLTSQSLAQPQSQEVHEVLTEKLFRAGRFEDAALAYGNWASAVSNASFPLLKQGECLLRANRPAEAVSPLKEAISRDAKNAEPVSYLAYAHYLLGNHSESEENLKQALEMQPGNGIALSVQVLLLADRHQFEKGREILAKAFQTTTSQGLTYSVQGYLEEQAGNTEVATHAYSEALRLEPNNGRVWGWLAGIQTRTAQTPETIRQAEESLAKAEALLPQASIVALYKGMLALKRKDYQTAISSLEEALRLNPESTEALYHLSVALERSGDVKRSTALRQQFETLRTYQREVNNLQIQLGRDPSNTTLWKRMLSLAQAQGDKARVQLATAHLQP